MTSPGVGFVVFEKVHGLLAPPVNTSAETKIAAACTATSTLFLASFWTFWAISQLDKAMLIGC